MQKVNKKIKAKRMLRRFAGPRHGTTLLFIKSIFNQNRISVAF
jgi:hypothetical protein